MMPKRNKIVILSAITFIIVLLGCYGAYHYYRLMHNNLVSKDNEQHEIYIYPDTDIDQTINLLLQHYDIQSTHTLRTHCRWLKFHYPEVGHYTIPSQCGDYQIIQMLKYGNQTPISITFNNIRYSSQLASRLSSQLLTDSTSIDSLLNDSIFLAVHNLTPQTSMLYFLPNSYQVYWTISAEQLFNRMQTEYKSFWNDKRIQKASKINLSPTEVSILASIVEEENASHPDEWETIAGLYLNRLRIGMPLQADPTVKYAMGDMNIKRVLNQHLTTPSAYNTYIIKGLPPGPIRVPSARAIDAVLNAKQHDYIFMCADYRLTGYHRFAKTSAEHAHNARLYQQELNRLKIYK